tara:strand:- start:1016 stop:1756 length:741 start_codon:yes stop_codon:yes gene_type:complete
MGNFFTVEVKPTIAASKQALAAFADGDLLFDWAAFDIPKGANRLLNVSVISRGPDGSGQSHAMNLYFAKTLNSGANAPGSLGTIHATANGTGYQNHLIGACTLEETDQVTGSDILTVHGIAGHGARMAGPNLVLQGEPDSGTNVGYDKLYVGGISLDGTPSFASTVQCDGIQATSQSGLLVKTTSALTTLDKGDVLHDEDDRLLGTVKSITDAENIVMTANLANATVNNKDVYCLNPIRLLLQFEG